MSLTTKEIIEIAIGIEENGYQFYLKCGRTFKDTAIEDVFDFLAQEELRHKALLQSFIHQGGTEIHDGKHLAYWKAIGDARLFDYRDKNINLIVAGITAPMDAIKHAFAAEKDSILFYSEMVELYLHDREASSLLDKIIEEERRHVVTLADLAEKFRLAQ
ncbi:MAG: hypothetical protein A2176_15395 [Spirochaetes bacterium RBG_13_51_14]|nr:MAG: hypothetical protein A2176_15395 [Spirochaetes bacterium RBG_13_51_14]